ncbi:Uncharacterised protein [Vibrio cholerae]|nr:Uncharacterised protein [Vibrio cholerae]CSC49357.1 Uncharacterised protein [Vibrio cholerae]CSC66495.1 Uncharacterised protein [Vibrio cholerae]CSC96945.1 Uncharacterised protein [Vibrio cholerae]CSD34535.1 Uncharacterised protein [Vibrio cholerae]
MSLGELLDEGFIQWFNKAHVSHCRVEFFSGL